MINLLTMLRKEANSCDAIASENFVLTYVAFDLKLTRVASADSLDLSILSKSSSATPSQRSQQPSNTQVFIWWTLAHSLAQCFCLIWNLKMWWKMVTSSQKDFVVLHFLKDFDAVFFFSSFKCKSPQCLIRLGTDWKNILYGIKASLWMQKRREQPSSSHLRFCRGYGDYEMGLLCEIMQTRQWITRLLFRLIGFHIKDFWKVFTLIFPYFTTSDMKCCLSNRLVYCRINVSLLEFWHVCVWSLGD